MIFFASFDGSTVPSEPNECVKGFYSQKNQAQAAIYLTTLLHYKYHLSLSISPAMTSAMYVGCFTRTLFDTPSNFTIFGISACGEPAGG